MAWNRVNFGPFAPDVADYNTQTARMAKHVAPVPGGYKSIRDKELIMEKADSYGLYQQLTGLWVTTDNSASALYTTGIDTMYYNSGTPHFIANTTGTSSREFQKTSGLARSNNKFAQITPVQWDETLYIFGDVSPPQKVDTVLLKSSSLSSDIGGSPPDAEFAAVVRQQMVIGKVYESATFYGQRVRWSAFGDPEGWTNGTNLAGQEDLRGGGLISGIVGGEYGLVFQETKITRMNFTGAPDVWEFDPISEGRGCSAPRSIIKVAEDTYFWGDDGFYVVRDGSRVEPVSPGRVNEYIRRNTGVVFDELSLWVTSICSAHDPAHNQIWWSFATTEAQEYGLSQRMIGYDINSGEWFIPYEVPAAQNGEIAGLYSRRVSILAAGDRHLPSVGMLLFDTTGPTVGAYDFSSATVLSAEIETGEIFTEGAKSYVRAARPLCDAQMDVQLITKETLDGTETEDSAVTPNSHGVADLDSEARYHRVRLVGGTTDDFDKCAGVMVDWEPSGEY